MYSQNQIAKYSDNEYISVRVIFSRLFPYVVFQVGFCALIMSYIHGEYIFWIWGTSILLTPVLTITFCRFFVINIKMCAIEVKTFWQSYEVEYGRCMRFCSFWFSPVIFCDDKNFNFTGSMRMLPKSSIVDQREAYEKALFRLENSRGQTSYKEND